MREDNLHSYVLLCRLLSVLGSNVPRPSLSKLTMAPENIRKASFGTLANGQNIESWTLAGSQGLVLEVLTYGGIVRRLLAPDRNGRVDDVVLGYGDLEGYLNDPFFMGATAGRVAGRIAGGRLKLAEGIYFLPINDPPNHLHGGPEALNTKVWKAEPFQRTDGAASLKLSYISPDGEKGYPGEVKLSVVYTVTANNEFIYETFAEADRPTPVSLTHHSYFNLSGEGQGDILEHRAEIFSSHTVAADKAMTLLNQLAAVDDSPADMRQVVRLGDVVPEIWERHGDLYWLGADKAMKPAARISDPGNGRVLTVSTTNPCLQTYFGAALNGNFVGKSGRGYERFGGFCMECEGYPEAANIAGFGDIMVLPGQTQYTSTVYAFSHSI